MIRRLTIWHARSDIPSDEAVRHWSSSHVPLVMAVPGVRRYRQSRCVRGPGDSGPTYTGLGELWFDSLEVAMATQTTPHWREVVDDAAGFMDLHRLTIAWAEEQTAS
jgi:uncharacterized protein (TIGR02118 family)